MLNILLSAVNRNKIVHSIILQVFLNRKKEVDGKEMIEK